MAINFPNSPSDGDLYSAVGRTWQYNSTASAWESISESNVTLTGLGLPNHDTLNINSSGQIGDHLIPDTNITRDLGTASNRWRDLYLSGSSIQLGTRQITQDNVPDVNLSIAPEVLEIQVDAPDAGQATMWKWTWEQSTLPYARRTITNSGELNVPLYKEGTYVVNNFAAYDIHGSMTQTHSLYLKWVDGAGTDNLVSWATSAGPISDTHPDINGGNATDVQRITVNVPSTITLPSLTNPTVSYSVVNNGSGGYTFSGSAKGDNPNIGPFYRGGTYTVNINATGHPFYFTTDNGTNFAAGTYFGEYTSGVTGSRTDSGTITFTVPAGAPDTLYYQCGNHGVMRGEITVKDLAVETNINGNYVVYFQHTQEGHKTPVELRPIPSLVNQMCLVYDSTSGKFVPQDLATYVENTPSFENKIREVAGTAELVVEDGSAVIAKVNVYDDSTYLPLTGNNPGDQAFATDTDILYIWDGSAWQQAGAANSDDLTEGSTNLFYTDERVDDRVSALIVGGNNITSTYNDAAGTLTIDGQPGYTDSDVGTYLSANDYDTATNIVASITDSAPATLDTLNELAAALGDDPNFATTVSTNIGAKLATADFDSTFDTRLATKSTTDLAEGTNLYYTDARADARIALQAGANLDLSGKSTTDLAEGTNLYYTQGRFDSAFATKISSDVTFGADVSADLVNATLLLQDDTIANGETYTIPSGKQVIVDHLDIIGDLDVQGTLATVSGGSLTQTTMKTQAITHTNGTSAINIASSGHIGIGTTSPDTTLDIRGSGQFRNTNGLLFFTDNGTAGATNVNGGFIGMAHNAGYHVTGDDGGFGSAANSLVIGNYHTGGGDIILATTNSGPYASGRVIIKENGNVGIGTASPGHKLQVNGTAGDGTELLRISSDGDVTNGGYHWMSTAIAGSQSTDANIIHFIGKELANKNGGYFGFHYAGDNSDNNFITLGGYQADQLLNIKMNGNVGIGTTNPGKKLDVNGEVRITTGLTITPATSTVYATDSTLSSYATGNGVYLNGHADGWLRLNGSGANRASVDVWGENYAAPFGDSITFRTGGTSDRMIVNASGNVIIGDLNTEGYKLEVVSDNAANNLMVHKKNASGPGLATNIAMQVTQTNGQSARLAEIGADFTSGWGGSLHFSTKNDNGAPNNSTTERMRIDADGRVTMPYQPSFRAGRNGNYVAGNNYDIVFNLTSGTQLFNTGGHYSTSTGLFTAPVAGSYIFHAVVIWGPSMPEGEDMADSFRFVYNGAKFHYSERRAEYVSGTTGNGGYYVDHGTCIVKMNANDTIGVRSQESVGVHGNAQYTTFQGHLLG